MIWKRQAYEKLVGEMSIPDRGNRKHKGMRWEENAPGTFVRRLLWMKKARWVRGVGHEVTSREACIYSNCCENQWRILSVLADFSKAYPTFLSREWIEGETEQKPEDQLRHYFWGPGWVWWPFAPWKWKQK